MKHRVPKLQVFTFIFLNDSHEIEWHGIRNLHDSPCHFQVSLVRSQLIISMRSDSFAKFFFEIILDAHLVIHNKHISSVNSPDNIQIQKVIMYFILHKNRIIWKNLANSDSEDCGKNFMTQLSHDPLSLDLLTDIASYAVHIGVVSKNCYLRIWLICVISHVSSIDTKSVKNLNLAKNIIGSGLLHEM